MFQSLESKPITTDETIMNEITEHFFVDLIQRYCKKSLKKMIDSN